MRTSAMLWTGGKDCALALHESLSAGHRVVALVTFAPENPDFLAHPLSIMAMQAEALGLQHVITPIRLPYEASYEAALASLRKDYGVDTLITGDIDLVNGQPNWICERARPLGLQVHMPLWQREREEVLRQLLAKGFRIVVSCVDTRCMPGSWAGRYLDEAAVAELRALHESRGVDLCGENGEYHTLTVASPDFRRPLELPGFSICSRDHLVHVRFDARGAGV